MPDLLAMLPLLFAQNPKAADPSGGAGGLPMIFIYFGPVLLLFYLMVLRPRQQEERKRQEMIGALKKNDRVLTSAGIYGTVVSVDDADRVVLRVSDDPGVKLAFSKASVVRVIEPASEKSGKAAETA